MAPKWRSREAKADRISKKRGPAAEGVALKTKDVALKIKKIVRFGTFSFYVFNRNDIHTQAFVDFINGK